MAHEVSVTFEHPWGIGWINAPGKVPGQHPFDPDDLSTFGPRHHQFAQQYWYKKLLGEGVKLPVFSTLVEAEAAAQRKSDEGDTHEGQVRMPHEPVDVFPRIGE